MCYIIEENIAGFIVGFFSSALVAWIFYSKGTYDSKKLHLKSQVDSILLAMARCDPTQRGSGRRGDDGLEHTHHWLLCMVDVLNRSGFSTKAQNLESICDDIADLIRNHDSVEEREVHLRKENWQRGIEELI